MPYAEAHGQPTHIKPDRLDSWKEIAAYLNRTIRTVQRWEKQESLPVHRLDHARQGSVYAYRLEVDRWLKDRETPVPKPVRLSRWLTAAGLAAVAGSIGWVVYDRLPRTPTFQNIQFRPVGRAMYEAFPAISPDGRYVALAVQGGGMRLIEIPTGKAVELLPRSGLKHMGITFSVDGRAIYFIAVRNGESAAALYRISTIGGEPERLKDDIDSPVSFSPDGREYVFVREERSRGESMILSADLATGQERRLASRTAPEYLDYPSWSPDAKTIVYTLVNQKMRQSTVLAIQASGGREQRLTASTWSFMRKLEWLQNGSGLLTSALGNAPGGYQIWYIAYPGGQARRVTTDLEDYRDVSVSRTARMAVIQQEKFLSSIWTVPLEFPAAALQIAEPRPGRAQAVWSPDGRILFTRTGFDEGGIWAMRPDGSGQRPVIGKGQSLSVCGDSRILYYTSTAGGTEGWIAGPDGNNARRLFRDAGDSRPDCSPDGSWVAYTAAISGGRAILWRIPTLGGAPRRLSDGLVRSPAISPDGSRIAVFYTATQSSSQTSIHQLAVLPALGGPPLRTFPISWEVDYLTGLRWSPDGKGITYVDTQNGVDDIWLLPLDGLPRRLTGFQADRISSFWWSPDGRRVVLSRKSEAQELLLLRW